MKPVANFILKSSSYFYNHSEIAQRNIKKLMIKRKCEKEKEEIGKLKKEGKEKVKRT
jgi:hypothetical protein